MGYPPRTGICGRRRFFCRFSAHFLRDSGKPIFQAPKRRRKICAPKICVRICAKFCAPRICAKNRFAHCTETVSHIPVFQKMEARKENLRQLAQNPSPKRPRERGRGKEAPVFLNPSKISLHSIPPHSGPLRPHPFLCAREEEEWESEKASASEIPEPRP